MSKCLVASEAGRQMDDVGKATEIHALKAVEIQEHMWIRDPLKRDCLAPFKLP